MAFLFPACPKCGGATESNEPDALDRNNSIMGAHLRSQAMLGHPHPTMRAIVTAISIGRFLWKRLPVYGGEKRCTVIGCGHKFT